MRQRALRNALLPICMIASLTVLASHAGVLRDDAAATPQGRAAEARWEKFADQNARSGDLRLQLLFGPGAIPLEQFVERARGSTDPFVLSTLSHRCDRAQWEAAASTPGAADAVPKGCDAVEFARRWVAVDAENQLAWLTLATRLDRRGDIGGARSAIKRAARASSYRTLYGEAARTIVRILPRDLKDVEPLAFAGGILAIAATQPYPTSQPLFRACKLPDMHSDCARIADVMFRDSEILVDLFVATALSAKLDVERETVRYRVQQSYAIRWILGQHTTLDEPSPDDFDAIKQFAREIEERASMGELAWFREALRKRGVSEADAAMRFEKSMTQEQRMHYEAMLKPWEMTKP